MIFPILLKCRQTLAIFLFYILSFETCWTWTWHQGASKSDRCSRGQVHWPLYHFCRDIISSLAWTRGQIKTGLYRRLFSKLQGLLTKAELKYANVIQFELRAWKWWAEIRVTRWLAHFSIFGHLQPWKFAKQCHKFAKVGSTFCQISNKK